MVNDPALEIRQASQRHEQDFGQTRDPRLCRAEPSIRIAPLPWHQCSRVMGCRKPVRLQGAALAHVPAVARAERDGSRMERSPPRSCFGSFTARIARPRAIAQKDENAAISRRRCFPRAYHVFNAEQVKGFSIPECRYYRKRSVFNEQRISFAARGRGSSRVGMCAYYDPKADEIHMRPFSQFKKADYFVPGLPMKAFHRPQSAQ